MAKRHKNKGHKAHSHGRGLSKAAGRGRPSQASRRKAKSALNAAGEAPELMDLDSGGAPDQSRGLQGTMRYELRLSAGTRAETMKKPLRKNPIVFVKAKEVYDPSAELFAKMDKKKNTVIIRDVVVEDENLEPADEIRVSEVSEQEECEADAEDAEPAEQLQNQDKDHQEQQEQQEIQDESEDADIQHQLYYVDVDGEGRSNTEPKSVSAMVLPSAMDNSEEPVLHEEAPSDPQDAEPGLELDPTFSIGKVYLNSKVNDRGELEARLPKANKYQSALNYISSIMATNRMYEAASDDEEEEEVADAPYDSSEEEFLMEGAEALEQNLQETKLGALSIHESEEEEDPEPEYGYCDEDYAFDVSQIDISSVRFGGDSRQFYAKSVKILGLDEHRWIDEETLTEILIDNAMAGHRVSAYFKYVMQNLGVQDEDPEEQPDYSLSESETEDEDEGEDEDGMDNMLQYARSGKLFSSGTQQDDNIPPTETFKTRGKGSNRRLDLDHMEDLELLESLQDQYIGHKQARKQKRQERESRIDEYDLDKKYPYVMYIWDMKEEFESFLHDANRSALTFPPLDPHGLKTISKMADFYNMKSRKLGKGLKQHVVVIKSKRTFHSVPYYNDINYMLKQRPYFGRKDVKRTKDEIAKSKDSAKTRSGGDSKSKANYKDGAIVGETAPEIGQENIGRQLLEKLGWSRGEGLGIDRSGISEPIQAKIKKTKLGLK